MRRPIGASHQLWRLLPARPRRLAITRATSLMAPRPDRPPPPVSTGLAVGGELSRASGLGEIARVSLTALERLGVPAFPLDLGTAIGAAGSVAEPPPGSPLLLAVNPPFLPLALLRLPRTLMRGRRVIGYWAWELPAVSPEWRAGARFVHEAWVLSRFTGQAIEPLLPGRIRVVTPPLALAPPTPAKLDRAAFGFPDGVLVILVSFSLASSFERKNPLGAITAFRAAFGSRPDRLLLLKVGNPGDFAADFRRLERAIAGAPNIRLETRTMPAADSHALTAAADIVLSLHRSEGFGLVPAEAMLLGRPVIATGWSGNMDFMDADCAALIGYRLVPARDPRGVFEAPGAVWAEPDLANAVERLCQLANDPQTRVALGSAGQAAARTRLGAASFTAALSTLGLVS
jgi:glycosyltransferase involved in cell wall biosynthesis